MTMRAWKFLRLDGSPTHGTGKWTPNVWRSVEGEIIPCSNGIHATTEKHLVSWIGPALHQIELSGNIIDAGDKFVARSGVVSSAFSGWNEQTQRLFAVDCAWRVRYLHQNPKVVAALVIVRGHAFGLCDDAAWAAARAAAGAATGAAAWAAARDAARDAAWAAMGKRLLAYACGGIDLDALRQATARDLPEAKRRLGL